jgi:hypothetical protein
MKRSADGVQRSWKAVEQALGWYAGRGSAANLKGLNGREGWWVAIRFGVAAVAWWALFSSWPSWIRDLSWVLALYSVLDVVVANTWIAFFAASHRVTLRSVILTLVAFITLPVAFAGLLSVMFDQFEPNLDRWHSLSLTLGHATAAPLPVPNAKGAAAVLGVSVMSVVHVYFLLIILTVIVGWVGENRPGQYVQSANSLGSARLEKGRKRSGATNRHASEQPRGRDRAS